MPAARERPLIGNIPQMHVILVTEIHFLNRVRGSVTVPGSHPKKEKEPSAGLKSQNSARFSIKLHVLSLQVLGENMNLCLRCKRNFRRPCWLSPRGVAWNPNGSAPG